MVEEKRFAAEEKLSVAVPQRVELMRHEGIIVRSERRNGRACFLQVFLSGCDCSPHKLSLSVSTCRGLLTQSFVSTVVLDHFKTVPGVLKMC